MLDPVALQGAEVIAVAKFGEQFLKDRPVALAAARLRITVEVALEVVLDAVVVEQGVIDIDQKNNSVS